jgi:hypothetical protein
MTDDRLQVKHGTTLATDEEAAVEEIRAQIAQSEPFTTVFFCSSTYDLPRLAAALRRAFPGALFGCTSSGQIGPTGFQRGGLTAVSLASRELTVTPHTIRPLSYASAQAAAIGRDVRASRDAAPPNSRAFGLLLIDGLSLAEERVTSALYQALGHIPLIGGSAGDDLAFEATHVLVDGEFVQDAALLLLFETTLPFRTFRLQHFEASGVSLVITDAEPDRRVVTEINGEPAAEEYARLIGSTVASLNAEVFSLHPLMLKIGGEYYVRSIQRQNPDGSLTFFCAIEVGLVLRVGRGVDAIEAIEAGMAAGARSPTIIFGCDCVLRRLEFEQRGIDAQVGALLARHRVFGFTTYGEQYNAIHVNQTFTGVSLGEST